VGIWKSFQILQLNMEIALTVGVYFKIVSYSSEQFLTQFDQGWSKLKTIFL
jgi:hypothetical protein